MKLYCYTLEESPPDMVPGRPERDWMDAFDVRHPYRCLPLVLANSSGWELQSPCAFTATWNGGRRIEDIRIDPDDDFPGLDRFASSHFSGGVLTMHTGYLFRTEPGWDLWVGGAPNHIKDGIQPLVGLVESDWLPFPFTMNWRFTRPGMVSFEKGEPFCFIMPVPHQALDDIEPVARPLWENAELEKECQAWTESRAKFIDNLKANDSETVKRGWQRHYFRGEGPSGEKGAADHVNRRRLKPLRPAKPGE